MLLIRLDLYNLQIPDTPERHSLRYRILHISHGRRDKRKLPILIVDLFAHRVCKL